LVKVDAVVGRVASGDQPPPVARMHSRAGSEEPGQRPEFTEITLVLDGTRVEHRDGD